VPAEERKRTRPRPGGHDLRREVLEHHQRERILLGAAAAIAEQGYRQTSVADIVRSAAIARASFYENFASKEDCFFALYDASISAALDLVAGACRAGGEAEFPERVRSGLEALLVHLGSDPVRSRAIIVEGPAVGSAITSRFESMIDHFAALLKAGRPSPPEVELPDTVEETVVGGLYWLLYYAILDRKPKRIEELLPQLVEFALIPFIGAEAARLAAPSD
jgi:AcrR family transcriptional regulator